MITSNAHQARKDDDQWKLKYFRSDQRSARVFKEMRHQIETYEKGRQKLLKIIEDYDKQQTKLSVHTKPLE